MEHSSPLLNYIVRVPEGLSLLVGPPFKDGEPGVKLERVSCTSARFSDDGGKLLAITGNGVNIYECDGGKQIQCIEVPGVIAAVFSPRGTHLQTFKRSSGGQDNNLVLWNIRSGTAVYQQSQKIMSKSTCELDLERHGLKLLPRNPSSFTPTLDGRYLLLGPDPTFNYAEISKFSERDAMAYPRYEKQLEKFCRFMDSILDFPPPEIAQHQMSTIGRMTDKLQRSAVWARLLQELFSMGQKDMVEFMDVILAPASRVLNDWFESEILKATLATDAIIGTMASVHTPGSGYVLLHHVMGETNGVRGIWSYVEGGMGAVSNAIAKAASEAGANLVTNAEVSQLIVDEHSEGVSGVLLADGTKINASAVLSNVTPWATFLKLTPANVLPEDFVKALKGLDYTSGTTKINIAVDKLPQFRSCKPSGTEAGPEHCGTIHLGAESMEEIDIASRDAWNGHCSRRPLIEMTIPSVLDKTISPPGKHTINLFIQYTPYNLQQGNWQDPAVRDAFTQRCFSLIDEYAPGFSLSIIGYDMLTPPDLEKVFGLTGGNIFHGAMGLDSLFLLRPIKGWSGYRTPLKGLYLCGAGSHPGGGVMGAPGRNAARVVLQDKRR